MNKAALITGSAKRLGKEIALHLSRLGFDIAIHYNGSQREAKETALEALKNDINCDVFKADLSDESDLENLIPKVVEKFPGLCLLVNNASVFESSKIKETDIASLKLNLNVHLVAPFKLSIDFARHCNNGNIINLLDTRIASSRTTYAAYSISKKSLADFTKMSAVEFGPNIRVNAIAPGLILPPEGKNKDYLNKLSKDIPLKKVGSIESITSSIEFILKNDFLTGQTIFCDGGEHLMPRHTL